LLRLQFLPHADHIIALDKGKVVAEGSYKQMADVNPHLFDEWRRRIHVEEEEVKRREMEAHVARERWKVLKAVTKFGLRRTTTTAGRTRHMSLKSPASFQSNASVLPLSSWVSRCHS
jgi:hypothetical protein